MSTPINISPPVITGDDLVGSLLTVSDGVWDNFTGTIAYQWQRDGSPIIGAVTNTYTSQQIDVGTLISCSVTATNPDDTASPTLINVLAYNTPKPVITEENNDTNNFAWTATGATELSTDNGSTWTDQTSPYDVGAVNIPIGELQVRVKEEGVNPASAAAVSTIAFTEDDEINLVDVVLYSKDLDGIDTTSVKVKLIKDSVKYKNNVVLRSETLTYTPEGTKGKVTMQLPDTDNMEDSANQYYVVEFTDSAYKIQVPNVSPVDFWDLSPTKTKIRI